MRPARTFRSPPQCASVTSTQCASLPETGDLVKLRIWEQQSRATRPPTHPPIQPEFTPQKDFLRQKNLKLTRVISIVLINASEDHAIECNWMQLNAILRIWYDEASHLYTRTQCGHFFLVLLEYNFPQVRRQWRAEWTWTPLLPFLCTTFSRCFETGNYELSCHPASVSKNKREFSNDFTVSDQPEFPSTSKRWKNAKRRMCLSWIWRINIRTQFARKEVQKWQRCWQN